MPHKLLAGRRRIPLRYVCLLLDGGEFPRGFQGSRILDPGSWIQDPGSWIQNLGFKFLDPGSGIQDSGSRILDSTILDPGSRIRDPGSRMLDPGSWILDPGSWIQDPGSWILDPWIQDPGSAQSSASFPAPLSHRFYLCPERPEQCPRPTGKRVRNRNVSGTSGTMSGKNIA